MNNHKKLYRLSVSAAVFVITFLLTLTNPFRKLDMNVRDNLYMSPLPINNDIKIIGIDDKTLEEYGPFGTWSRDVYAKLVEALDSDEQYHPAVIGFDIMFFGDMDEAGDNSFAQTAEKYGNVIVSSRVNMSEGHLSTDESGRVYIDDFYINQIDYPYDALAASADTGFVNISSDRDGIVRRLFPYIEHNGEQAESLSLKLYKRYCEKMGIRINDIPVDRNGNMLIRFTGRPSDYEMLSFCDVAEGRIDTKCFTDCIVLVGAYAQGLQDSQSVPAAREQMYGVEIHANIIQAMLDGNFVSEPSAFVPALIFAVVSVLLYLLMAEMNVGLSTVVFVLAEAAGTGLICYLSTRGIFVSIIYLPAMVFVVYIICVFRNYLSEKIRRRQTLNAFRKYVDPKFIDRMQKSGEDFHIELGGETKHCSFLFVDIRGFTAMSECLTSKEVVSVLNKYLKLTTDCIIKNGGTIDKFIGDCTMGIFNAPFDLDDYVFRSVCAGFDIISGSEEFSSHIEDGLSEESVRKLHERFTDNGKIVGFGVGVHCGDAVVGNIGCEFRMDYTAIGDTVNTASRIEAGAKAAQLCVSEDVYELVKDRVETDGFEEKSFKNKALPVKCYNITGVKR